jgi:hypothetical protein
MEPKLWLEYWLALKHEINTTYKYTGSHCILHSHVFVIQKVSLNCEVLIIYNQGITVGTVLIMCMKPLAVSTQHCFYVQKYDGHREYNCPLELHPELGACFLAHKVHLG